MRVRGYNHIYGFQGRLHDLGGWRPSRPPRYTTLLAVGGTAVCTFVPLFLATVVLRLALAGGWGDWRGLFLLLTTSAIYVIPWTLMLTVPVSYWLVVQVKRDRGLRGVLELYRLEAREWRRARREARHVEGPRRLVGSHIRRDR